MDGGNFGAKAVERADGRGWDVVIKAGTATVIRDGNFLNVSTPGRRVHGSSWYMGRRVQNGFTLPALTYRVKAGTDPVTAVRFCLAHGETPPPRGA
jgi:hypothetical protein